MVLSPIVEQICKFDAFLNKTIICVSILYQLLVYLVYCTVPAAGSLYQAKQILEILAVNRQYYRQAKSIYKHYFIQK